MRQPDVVGARRPFVSVSEATQSRRGKAKRVRTERQLPKSMLHGWGGTGTTHLHSHDMCDHDRIHRHLLPQNLEQQNPASFSPTLMGGRSGLCKRSLGLQE